MTKHTLPNYAILVEINLQNVLAKLRPLLDEREWERVTSPRPTFEEIKSGDRIPTYRELEIVLKQDRPDNPFKRKYQPLELSPALLNEFLSKSRRLRASGGDFSNDGAMEIVNAVGESPNPPPELLEEMNLWLSECPVLEYDAAVSVAGNLLRHQPDNPAARKVILLDQRRYSPSFIR